MIGSNEDLDKLLTPHDDLPENEEGELYTGNNTADNLLREITDEKHSYKSAGLFVVNPSDLENEFQDNNISSESPFSGVTQEVEDTFEKLAEGQREENDQFRDEDFRPASEGEKVAFALNKNFLSHDNIDQHLQKANNCSK